MNTTTKFKRLSVALLFLSLLSSACTPPGGSSSSGDYGQLPVGQFSNNGVVQPAITPVFPKEVEEPPVVALAQKTRVRQNADGTKVFEYLDPASTDQEVWKPLGKIEIHPAGTQFYHWGPEADVKHWATKGITNEEIHRAVRSVDDADYLGGGFYMSLDHFDSSDYGPKVIIADLKKDVVTWDLTDLDYNYNSKDQTIVFFSEGESRLAISVPMVSESGVETIRYRDNWMVVIQGSAVANLIEGSWANFVSYSESQNKSLTILDLIQFSKKYPLTEGDTKHPSFEKQFPLVHRIYRGENLTKDEEMELVKPLVQKTMDEGMNLDSLTKGETGLARVIEKIQTPLRLAVVSHLQDLLKKKTYDIFEWKYSTALRTYNVTIADISPGLQVIGNPNFFDNKNYQMNGPIFGNMAPNLREFTENLGVEDFYVALNRLVKGQVKFKSQEASSSDRPEATVQERLMEKLYDGNSKRSLLEKAADFWAQKQVSYRSAPLIETGKYFLDGPNKPGYLYVSKAQKEEIESNPMLLIQNLRPAEGGEGYYLQYEYPSARTFSRFSNLLQPELAQQLRVAAKQGQLKSPDSKTFKTLTRAIVRQLTEAAIQKRGTYAIYALNRIHPFEDREVNQKAILAMKMTNGSSITVIEPDRNKVLTYLEMAHLSSISGYWNYALSRTLQKDSEKIDLNQDIGLWEVAADFIGPHSDPLKFIEKVRNRFADADVQTWIQNKDYSKVQKALNQAATQ